MSDNGDNSASNQGEALEGNESASLSGMLSTLAPVAITAAVLLAVFLILRRSQKRYYAPRTYLGSLRENERTPALPSGFFNWIGAFWKIPDTHALRHQSLDAYLFLRFLRMCTVICFVGCCITWPVLFPVNATGGGGQEQLDILSFSNVDRNTQKNRYYAHALIVWVFYGFVMYLIMRECIFYINLRQAFLLSPIYAKRISSRTVLFTSVPTPYLDAAKLRKIFGGESVRNIWITGDTKALDEIVEERDKVAMKLEKAEVKLVKLANKARVAEQKKQKKKGDSSNADAAAAVPPADVPLDAESGSVAARWVPKKKRPTHRTGALGLIGPKVDTIDWCRTELQRLVPEVEAAQTKYRSGDYKKIPGVFIEFVTQSEAQAAYQVLAHHAPLHMSPRHIGIQPGEVIWKSLTLPWWQLVVRRYIVLAFIAAMIIFWAIPVAAVGAISNVDHLKTISWLTWLDKIPSVIMGVITGLLPAVLLSILMSLVPIVMRLCAKLAGEPSLSRVELFTQNAYFAFQVIQVFLITTVSSSAAAVAKQIYDQPTKALDLLSSNLPKSSNFYISYFIVQGLTIASSVLSQVAGFVIFKLLYKFLAGTPRAMYSKWTTLSAISWGNTLPVFTNIAVISITYAGIAPLMMGWATIGMGLFYLAYRYNVLYVTDTTIDTRGLIYPRALKQLFTGIYLAELCMIGLFAVSVATGPLVLTVIFLVFTVLFHISLSSALDPLLYNMPRTLLVEEESRSADLEAAGGVDPGQEGEDGASPSGEKNGHSEKKMPFSTSSASAAASAAGRGNIFTRFLKPWVFADYPTLRRLVPHDEASLADLDNLYPGDAEANAYHPPSVGSAVPLLWIPEDPAGVSKQEVSHTSKVIPITDEGCSIDDKNHLVWDAEGARPPVWEEKVRY